MCLVNSSCRWVDRCSYLSGPFCQILGTQFISESCQNQSLEPCLSSSVINRKLVFYETRLALCGLFIPELQRKKHAAVAHQLLISQFQESCSCALQISRGFPAVHRGWGEREIIRHIGQSTFTTRMETFA